MCEFCEQDSDEQFDEYLYPDDGYCDLCFYPIESCICDESDEFIDDDEEDCDCSFCVGLLDSEDSEEIDE